MTLTPSEFEPIIEKAKGKIQDETRIGYERMRLQTAYLCNMWAGKNNQVKNLEKFMPLDDMFDDEDDAPLPKINEEAFKKYIDGGH